MSSDVNKRCWYLSVCSMIDTTGCEYCTKFKEMNYLMEHSWLPKSKQKIMPGLVPQTDNDIAMFEELDELKSNIKSFVKSGKNLYIGSKYTGNGKTTWAIKLLHKYFETVWKNNCYKVRGLFVHVPTLLLKLKNFENPITAEEYDNLKNCDLVVWDDIASLNMSSYDYTQLLAIIDYRMLADKSNIYTANVITERTLQDILGERLTSRVYKSSRKIIFTGKDNRTDD